jgi:hypothetical protein
MANFFFTVFYTHVTKYRKALNMNNRINNSGNVSFNARYLKPFYKAPKETSTEKIVKQIENIKDMDDLLK